MKKLSKRRRHTFDSAFVFFALFFERLIASRTAFFNINRKKRSFSLGDIRPYSSVLSCSFLPTQALFSGPPSSSVRRLKRFFRRPPSLTSPTRPPIVCDMAHGRHSIASVSTLGSIVTILWAPVLHCRVGPEFRPPTPQHRDTAAWPVSPIRK